MLEGLSLPEKIGHLLMVGFDGLQAPDYILEGLAQGRISNIIFFARNIASAEQLATLTETLRKTAKHPIMIAVDQEGGTVARLRQGFTESPGAMALGAADSEALAEEVGEMMGKELRAVGINWNLAPVVDMPHNINNPSVGTRALGSDAKRVGQLAAAQIRGFQKAGVAASAKHFPGLGNTAVDTHEALAIIEEPVSYLWEKDLIPFRMVAEAGAASIMMTHVQFCQLDANYPSTMSHHVISGLLRDQMGYAGVVCTDCMEMNAITLHFSPGDSAVRALAGGADMVLFSHTEVRQTAAFEGVLQAVENGALSLQQIDQALGRVLALKSRFALSEPPTPQVIRQAEHLATSQKAARASIALIKGTPPTLQGKVGLVEFTPDTDSMAMDATGLTHLTDKLTGVEAVMLPPQRISSLQPALDLAQTCDTLVIATRNAHLYPAQVEAVKQLLAVHPQAILVCLRNPFDAQVLESANTILCSFGDSTPSLEAMAEALQGKFTPTAKSPVPLA